MLATPKTRTVSKQVFSLIKFKWITQTCQGLQRNLIPTKVLIGTICEGLLFEAGLRADEPLTWSVLAIPPPFWLNVELTGRKCYFEIFI